jgi:uncharacterized protein (TIGR03545 family)
MTPISPKKTEKKVGPFRTGLVTVILVFVVLWSLYCKLFLDNHIRFLLEWGGTQGNGAEVNIADVKTSFWDLSLKISKVQVTNAEMPSQNLVEFDALVFKMTMDALLRGKILIEDASLLGLRLNSKRAKVGRVLPPKPVEPGSDEPSPMMKAVLKQRDQWVKNELETSVLGDVVALLQSDDFKDALNESLKDLKSEQQINKLLTEWPEKRKVWESKVAEFKKNDSIEKLYLEAKAIKPSKDPKEILDQIKQVKDIRKKAKSEYENYKKEYATLNQDVTSFKNQVNSIPEIVKQDIDAIKQKMKIPSLDAKKSGQEIFQRMIHQYTGAYVPYLEKARPYWESSQKAKAERPKPSSRGQGINVHFPITKGYPTFWLKKMAISSDSKNTANKDNQYALQGELKNVTTHPKVVNAPIDLILKGDLISQEILGLNSIFSIDLRDTFLAKAAVDIASLPVKEFSMAKSNSLQLALNQAKAKMNLAMLFSKGEIDFKTKIDLSQSDWAVKTEKEKVTESVTNILKEIKGFYVLASLNGPWNKADMDIDTDFMDRFLAGIKLEVERKVAEIKVKIEQQIKEKINLKQNELVGKLSSDQKEILGPLLSMDGSKEGLIKGFDQVEKDLEAKAKEKGKEKFSKELDKLKNKIKLPF